MDNNLKIKLEKYYDKHAWRKITLGQALVNWSKKYKDTIAISDNGKEFSYEQLNEEANKFAYGFKEQGFKKGDKVVLQIPIAGNLLRFLLLFLSWELYLLWLYQHIERLN